MPHDLDSFLKTHKKTHLIFDFDETIVELLLPWEKAIDKIKPQLEKLDPKHCRKYEQNKVTLSEFQNYYVRIFGNDVLKLFITNNKRFEKEKLKGYKINKHMVDFIKNAKTYNMFIWSSNTRATITKILLELGILNKFKMIVTRDDVVLVKPEVDGFNKLQEDKTPKADYLFVGDSKHDKLASEKIGIDYFQEDYFKSQNKY